MIIEDEDRITVVIFSETYHKARTPKRCVQCFQEIPAGATYRRLAGKVDGELFVEITCLGCPPY